MMSNTTRERRWRIPLRGRRLAPAFGFALCLAALGAGGLDAQEPPEEDAYRRAREAVVRGQFERAAELFAELRERFPESRYGAESMYWEAFAQYRMDNLRAALALLEARRASNLSARVAEDSRDLELRIRSMLGRRGDAQAAARALQEAEMALAAVAGRAELGRSVRLAQEALAAEELAARQALLARGLDEMAERSVADRAAMAMEIAAVRASTERMQEACEDDVRHAAIQAVMQMDPERAIPLLRGVLEQRDECAVSLRKQAIFVLGQHEAGLVEDLIIDVARNDPDAGVQEAAVFWLSQVGSERAAAVLAEILESSDNPVLQENAIFALSQHRSDRAGEVLRGYALDSSKPERAREKAIFWLSQHPDHADADFLIELYGQLDTPALKEHIFIHLAQLNDPSAANWVLERAMDSGEDPEVRRQALFWAGQQPGLELGRLEGLYGRLADRGMREQLIYLYAQRDEPERVDRLIEIARVEEDPELRKAAIFWLGQTGDQRAIDFLVELLDDPPPDDSR